MTRPIHILAFGFGAGWAPRAPGTVGTLVGVVAYVPLAQLSLPVYVGVVIALAIVGIAICGVTARDLGVADHPGIVWDEIIGLLVTMTALPGETRWVVLGFLLFRLFDIWKPWPIGWLDRRVRGGLGIMLDDLVAGGVACCLLHGIRVTGWFD